MADEIASQDGGGASPDLLYHYTTENGMFGILDSSEIWPTHIRFLNDLSEQSEGSSLFEREFHLFFGEKAKGLIPGNRDSLLLSAARAIIRITNDEVGAYIMSFTKDAQSASGGDRLSQWRAYGPGTSGVCLGFDRKKLEAQTSSWAVKRGVNLSILECSYEETEKISNARALLGQLASLLNLPSPEDSEWLPGSEVLGRLFASLRHDSGWMNDYLTWAARCKHMGFEEEDESRIIVRLGGQHSALVSFRDGRFASMPHLKIPMIFTGSENPPRRIVVGPSLEKEQSVVRLRIDLAQRGIANVEVRPSQLPYRSW